MNELVKEIAEQSGAGWDDKYHWYVGNEQMKKFAKLIVQECIKEMEEFTIMSEDYVQWNQALSHVALYLKDHFEVED